MHVYYQPNALKRLDAKLAYVKGRGAQNAALAIARAIEGGNTQDRLGGRDRYGRAIAALRSPRKGVYRGKTGPPLAPSGLLSRVISAFRAKARRRGGAWQIVAGWLDVVSAKGYHFLPAHDQGWGRNPIRAIFGISPRTWSDIRDVIARFKAGVRQAR